MPIVRFAKSLDLGSTWSSPNTISTAGSNAYGSYFPVVAPLGVNGMVLNWVEEDGANTRAMLRTTPNLNQWSAPIALSVAGSNVSSVSVATNSAEHIVSTWQILDGNGKKTLVVAGSANWNTSTQVMSTNPSNNYPSPALVTLSNGNIALTWFDLYDNVNNIAAIYTTTTADGGANWSPGTIIANNLRNYGDLSVTKTHDGSLLAAWSSSLTGWQNIHSARGNATNTTWSTPIDVIAQGSSPYAGSKVVSNLDGTAMITFRVVAGGQDPIFTALSSNNGTSWDAPVQLATQLAGYPGNTLGISPLHAAGYAVVWNTTTGNNNYTNYLRTYDWSSPATPVTPSLANTGSWINPLWLGSIALGFLAAGTLFTRIHRR